MTILTQTHLCCGRCTAWTIHVTGTQAEASKESMSRRLIGGTLNFSLSQQDFRGDPNNSGCRSSPSEQPCINFPKWKHQQNLDIWSRRRDHQTNPGKTGRDDQTSKQPATQDVDNSPYQLHTRHRHGKEMCNK
ncbi:hypothetical protein AMECASPLE_005962 [Ameca splendens]|uniref:Uncharacterized protein n=1 Tax=Ameca splendens TaxID=208324 RepID=A0ABV0ZJX4_9TELE